jgi:hypothetical protein
VAERGREGYRGCLSRRSGDPTPDRLSYAMTEAQASAYILKRRHGWNTDAKAAFGIFDRHFE